MEVQQQQEQQKNEVKFLTQEEVADRFRVSSGTIINWRKKGLLRYFRVSGSTRVLYPIDTVEELEQQSLHQEKEVFRSKKIVRERPGISPRQKKDWRI